MSVRSCAWLSVLNPVQSQSAFPPFVAIEQTLIAIDIGILNHYRSAIDGRILLCLPPILSHVRNILPSRRRSIVSWYSQDMATQKLLRSRKICVEDSGLAIAGGKEDFS